MTLKLQLAAFAVVSAALASVQVSFALPSDAPAESVAGTPSNVADPRGTDAEPIRALRPGLTPRLDYAHLSERALERLSTDTDVARLDSTSDQARGASFGAGRTIYRF